jgi:hypothetical protein
MQLAVLRTSVLIGGVLTATLCVYPQSTPNKEAHSAELQGIPPRAAPDDYQVHAKAGAVTVAAEFIGHFVPTSQGTLTTDEYVVVETGVFGEPGARIKLSSDDFSLRINGKKTALPSQRYGMVVGSLKDPDWEPPASPSPKSKTSIGGGGASGNEPNSPPPRVVIPIEVQRAMAQRVQKASLAEGDRDLPRAGLLFFQYRGKSKDIPAVELIYNGAAGQATLALQP